MALPAYTDDMTQLALYWAPGAADGFGGVGYAAPIAIVCRWQTTVVMFRDGQGRQVASEAVVYPDRVLEIGGYLALTTFEDEALYTAPSDVDGAKEIRWVGASPDLGGVEQLNKVIL